MGNSTSQDKDFQLGGLWLKRPSALVESGKPLECRILPHIAVPRVTQRKSGEASNNDSTALMSCAFWAATKRSNVARTSSSAAAAADVTINDISMSAANAFNCFVKGRLHRSACSALCLSSYMSAPFDGFAPVVPQRRASQRTGAVNARTIERGEGSRPWRDLKFFLQIS